MVLNPFCDKTLHMLSSLIFIFVPVSQHSCKVSQIAELKYSYYIFICLFTIACHQITVKGIEYSQNNMNFTEPG